MNILIPHIPGAFSHLSRFGPVLPVPPR